MPRTGTKFTRARRELILEAIAEGLPVKMAAARGGISKQALYDWLKKGDQAPDGQYGQFLRDFEAAESLAAADALSRWKAAFPDDWRAAMEFLSRRFPDDFGKRERHEVSGPQGEPIRVEIKWPGVAPE